MGFIDFLRDRISPQNRLLLFYHKLTAIAAAFVYGFPGNHLKVIAITGTKGKSTVAHLLAGILGAAGFKVGLATTIAFQIGDRIWPNATKQTTQGRFVLQRLLKKMADQKCDFAVLEVTSHALAQSRLWGVSIDTAILTNISGDHIEYHGGFEEYKKAKGKLFAMLHQSKRKPNTLKTSILPSDESYLNFFSSFPADRRIIYGRGGDFSAENSNFDITSSRFTLATPNGNIDIHLKIPGDFNVRNALAASCAAFAHGISLKYIKQGIESVSGIPGRVEAINCGQQFRVIVDYAHTPDSLEKLLQHFRPVTKGKLHLVFGCTGGGRDKAKRPEMGEIADRYADQVYVTDDDPYTEDRMSIIEQVALGIHEKREGENLWKIPNRRKAIELAISRAAPNDSVLIAGKGCEPIQIIGCSKIPWDDRKVVREILAALQK